MKDLAQEVADLLAAMSVLAEGSATKFDPTHATTGSESRPPLDVGTIKPTRADTAPDKYTSLYDHWRWRFEHARGEAEVQLLVYLAREDVIRRHLAPRHVGADGTHELYEHKSARILNDYLGRPPMEVAAKVGCTAAHVETLRLRSKRDPVTGELWPDDPEARLARAVELVEREAVSDRVAAGRCSVSRTTLRRRLAERSA
jgi:hypothetical protein